MRPLWTVAALTAGLLLNAPSPASAADGPSFDDTAKFLAGMPPSPNSVLAPLTQQPSWQQHAKHFDTAWGNLENRQLSRVRAWTSKNMTGPQKTLFYMFSGPDYLYANAFFPSATTYVLSGLERPGPIPDLLKLKGTALPAALNHLKVSLHQVISHSYFITSQMGAHLARGQLNGTIPLLYVFLARSGKTIRDVSHVQLESDGSLKPFDATAPRAIPRAVKIVFTSGGGPEQTLYFFSTDLANNGVAKSGFLKFCAQFAPGDSFVKSASYLLHDRGFSSVRDFMLANSVHILQDDTGVPVAQFRDDTWTLQPYGNYTRPIPVFAGKYQPRMSALFAKGKPGAMDFGIGYRWRQGQSSMLLATRKPKQTAASP